MGDLRGMKTIQDGKVREADTTASCDNTRVRWLCVCLASVYILECLFILCNQLGHKEIYSEAEAFHAQYYWQFSQGQHCYYPKGVMIKYTQDGYTPLAAQIYGQVIRWGGLDIRIIRLARALFGFGGIAIVGLLVFHFTRLRWLAVTAAGLCAGMEPFWFMETGPNNMHVFWALLGLWLLVREPRLSWRTALLSTLAFFACFWTKQTGLGYVLAHLFYLLVKDWRKGLAMSLVYAVLTAWGVWYFMHLPDCDFLYWTVNMNANAPLVWSRLWDPLYFPVLLGRFTVLMALIVAGLLVKQQRLSEWLRPESIFLVAAGCVGCFCSLKHGSGLSQAWFFYCMMIICGTVLGHRLWQTRHLSVYVLACLLSVQLLAFAKDFRPCLIDQSDVQRHEWLMKWVTKPGKSVFYVGRAYWNILAGKDYFSGGCDGCYIKGVFHPEIYPKAWRDYFESDPFDIVIVDIPPPEGYFPLYDQLNKSYTPVEELPPDSRGGDYGCLRRKKIVFIKKTALPK